MIALLLCVATGWSGPLSVPVQEGASPGDCAQATPLQVGRVVPPALLSPEGTARCTGVVLPPFQVAYLLKVEQYQTASEKLHMLDVKLLETERDWYRDKLATETEPGPWYERPAAQRWLGRAEVLAVLIVAAGGMGYAYNAGK